MRKRDQESPPRDRSRLKHQPFRFPLHPRSLTILRRAVKDHSAEVDRISQGRSLLVRAQAEKLLSLLRAVVVSNPFYRGKLSGLDHGGVPGEALERILDRLPFTTKEELLEDQADAPPFGRNLTCPLERYTRFHQTSGTSGRPLRWIDTPESWGWVVSAWEEVYRAAGVTESDRVFFPFSFGPFLGFWAAFEAASSAGCLSIAGGGLSTLARLRLLLDSRATVLAATPTYALYMAQTARAQGIDITSSEVRMLIVAGEPGGSIPSTRARMEEAWGARVFDHCGLTEVGPFGLECQAGPGGMHALEREFVIEVIDPKTRSRLEPQVESQGMVEGELVVTSLGRTASPVIRYRTGDIVRWSLRPCPCGRPWGRFEGGILARMDDMVFLRGNNLYPSAVEAILRKFPEIAEYRVTLRKLGEMTSLGIEVEPHPGSSEQLGGRVSRAVESELLFRAEVKLVPEGSLPRFELKGKRFIKEGF